MADRLARGTVRSGKHPRVQQVLSSFPVVYLVHPPFSFLLKFSQHIVEETTVSPEACVQLFLLRL